MATPQGISVTAYDMARDYQSATQQIRVAGGKGPQARLDLPATMAAGEMHLAAQYLGEQAASGQIVYERPVGLMALLAPPGRRVATDDGGDLYVIERRISGDHITLQLGESVAVRQRLPSGRDGGRHIATPDHGAALTRAALCDLPAIADFGVAGGFMLAAAGTSAGWRGAALAMAPVAGAPLTDFPPVERAARLGSIEAVASHPQSALCDLDGYIIVRLVRPDIDLPNIPGIDLLGGANLAMAGDEFIQFARAEALGGGRWRLSELLRGRLGSEAAMAGLAAGHAFALLDDAVHPLPGRIGMLPVVTGGHVQLLGLHDAHPLRLPLRRLRDRPLSPVQPCGAWLEDGTLSVNWIARSYDDFAWDTAPEASAVARFQLQIRSRAGAALYVGESQIFEVAGCSHRFESERIAIWRKRAPQIEIAIHQMGHTGQSDPLVFVMSL